MRTDRVWSTRYRICQIVEAVAVFTIASVSIVNLLVECFGLPTWVPSSPKQLTTIRTISFLVISICGVVVPVTEWGKRRIGHPNTWAQVQAILEFCEEELFRDSKTATHCGKVTLFHRVQWCWWGVPWRKSVRKRWGKHGPGSGWLIPVARSGHTQQNCRSVFAAPDDAENAEGVAGQAWALGKRKKCLATIRGLKPPSPLLSTVRGQLFGKDYRKVENDIAEYAKRTFVSLDWMEWAMKHKSSMPKEFSGMPIEIEGSIWGCLVIDSSEDPLPSDEVIERATAATAKLLNAALKGTLK